MFHRVPVANPKDVRLRYKHPSHQKRVRFERSSFRTRFRDRDDAVVATRDVGAAATRRSIVQKISIQDPHTDTIDYSDDQDEAG